MSYYKLKVQIPGLLTLELDQGDEKSPLFNWGYNLDVADVIIYDDGWVDRIGRGWRDAVLTATHPQHGTVYFGKAKVAAFPKSFVDQQDTEYDYVQRC